jgi:hypothetical protein
MSLKDLLRKIMETVMLQSSIENLTSQTVRNSMDGLTHSHGTTQELMMIQSSSNKNTMSQKAQQKKITVNLMLQSFIENLTSPMVRNSTDGLTLFHGTILETMMTPFSSSKSMMNPKVQLRRTTVNSTPLSFIENPTLPTARNSMDGLTHSRGTIQEMMMTP